LVGVVGFLSACSRDDSQLPNVFKHWQKYRNMKKFLFILLLLGLVFSDIVGPPPPEPSITLHFLLNGEKYTGPISVIYFCDEGVVNETNTSPLNERTINFTCDNGVCTNGAWFYKFNPCFYPEKGHFEIYLGKSDAIIRVDQKRPIKDGGSYTFTIDLNRQRIVEDNYCILSSLFILAVLFIVYTRY